MHRVYDSIEAAELAGRLRSMLEQTKTDHGPGQGGPAYGDAGLVRIAAVREHASTGWVALPERATVVVGREAGPGRVVIAEDAVSRTHARVERAGDRVLVTDLGSKNGTFVNRARIADPVVLADGDVVRFGDTAYAFASNEAGAIADAFARASALPFGFVGGARLRRVIEELVSAARGAKLNVSIHGESGTGKELAARAVHQASGRTGRFQAVNCAAIPMTLFESELFGHRRGAFTGALRDNPGHVRMAHGGTLFLDEIGELPLEAQAKLLRVLELREVVPVGATQAESVDVHVVSATHQDLAALVQAGRFRGDLFARLAGFGITLPALRRRREDVPMLVRHVLGRSEAAARLDPEVLLSLVQYDWPYNVRELASAVERAIALAAGAPLSLRHFPEAVQAPLRAPAAAAPGVPATGPQPRPPVTELVALLAQHNGNVSSLARALGKDRAQVGRWLREARIDVDTYRR